MMLNLILIFVWILIAAAIFLSGDPRFVLHLGGVGISSGWLAVLLAFYNLVRWWSTRSYWQQREAARRAEEERERKHREAQRREAQQEPDPNFNFNEPPPPV